MSAAEALAPILRTAPVQLRSTKRIQAIADATREAIRIHGRDHFTTNDVAALAGCSIGVVYRYFDDRLALLEYVYPGGYITVETVEEISALPVGTVLLCNVDEVFWLAPGELGRWWYAAGYDPKTYAWSDAMVADWGPLRILHRGAEL